MPARLEDSLSSKVDHRSLPVTFGINFLSYRWNSLGIFIALISYSSLANANCSEELINKLIDNHFTSTQVIQLCGKVASQPPASGNTIKEDVKAATALKPASNPQPAVAPKPAIAPNAATAPLPTTEPNATTAPKTPADPNAAADANSIKPGAIQSSRHTTADLSGRLIKLKQDDSQYHAFKMVGNPTRDYVCGLDCEYRIKDDNNKDLTVNIITRPLNKLDNASSDKVALVEVNKDYTIDKATHEGLDYAYRGVTFGALVVPFKWQFHDHSIAGSASLGPYVGYQMGTSWGGFGLNIIPLASFGITNIAVQNQTNSSTLSNAMGFTLAVGAGFSINKSQSSLQGGFICGQDRAGTSTPTPYKYEGKTWCALELGFPFTQ